MKEQDDAPESNYLTVAEAAAALRVSRTTVWRWIGEGRLMAHRAGRRTIRIRREDLRAALRPARATSNGEPPRMRRFAEVRVAEGDIWADYDPARVRTALRSSAGALPGIDRRTFLEDILADRGQDSRGRPE